MSLSQTGRYFTAVAISIPVRPSLSFLILRGILIRQGFHLTYELSNASSTQSFRGKRAMRRELSLVSISIPYSRRTYHRSQGIGDRRVDGRFRSALCACSGKSSRSEEHT